MPARLGRFSSRGRPGQARPWRVPDQASRGRLRSAGRRALSRGQAGTASDPQSRRALPLRPALSPLHKPFGNQTTRSTAMPRSAVLVDADWVQAHLGDPGLVLVEVDEDTTAYHRGHIKGAVKLDWKNDLQDQVRRDFVDRAGFEALLSQRGIANEDTVILYGGNNNWFAAYAYWYFKLYGHKDVRLLDGGRKKWELDARDLVPDPPQRPQTA